MTSRTEISEFLEGFRARGLPHGGYNRPVMYDAKASVSGDPGVGYFPGERSEPVFLGAAGENFADFKAEMADSRF